MNRAQAVGLTPKDQGLRNDVRTLGAMVGAVLREQGGEPLYALVEGARRAAIARRGGALEAGVQLQRLCADLEPGLARAAARAFGLYFQMVNMAERIHRVRRWRDQRQEGHPIAESLEDTCQRLRQQHVSAELLAEAVGQLHFEPVLTAHPTQAVRRSILQKQRAVARYLVMRLDTSASPDEQESYLEAIRAEITMAWQTEPHPDAGRTVDDELGYVLFYFLEVFYPVVPAIHDLLERSLQHAGVVLETVPAVVRLGSWVGGDMDGNPNAGAATITRSLTSQRQRVLSRYQVELGQLAARLTQSSHLVTISAPMARRLEHYQTQFAALYQMLPPRQHDMPYRLYFRFLEERVRRSLSDEPGGYDEASQLQEDLDLALDSLDENKGRHAGWFAIKRLWWRVRVLGFHLATLDLRQASDVHRRCIAVLLGDPGWLHRQATARTEILAQRLCQDVSAARGEQWSDSEQHTEVVGVLEVFRAIKVAHERYGQAAIGPYIVSMAQGIDDVLTVLLLARWAALQDESGHVPLDVAPLFETLADLEAAPGILEGLFQQEVYRGHLAQRGMRQVVMLGYSDSNKDAGFCASRLAIHVAQQRLSEVARHHGVQLVIFHGRGGTPSRGGSKPFQAILALPRAATRGTMRLTEQGEMIEAKYGMRAMALRTMEQNLSALLHVTLAGDDHELDAQPWRLLMTEIARDSHRCYRELIDDPRFWDYFQTATPIDVIQRMRIGSRPASRGKAGGIGELRAIPWVFAWTQSRHLLTGWYGLGSALQAACGKHGTEELRCALQDVPFVHNLMDDAEMTLAKVDMGIAALYADLAPEASRVLFGRIREEYELTVAMVLELRGNQALLDSDRDLQRSLQLRSPYMDPLGLMQVDLLRRWREGGRKDQGLLHALLETVGGIAQAMQNTG